MRSLLLVSSVVVISLLVLSLPIVVVVLLLSGVSLELFSDESIHSLGGIHGLLGFLLLFLGLLVAVALLDKRVAWLVSIFLLLA